MQLDGFLSYLFLHCIDLFTVSSTSNFVTSNHNIVKFECTKPVHYDFYVCILGSDNVVLSLRCAVTRRGVYFFKSNIPMVSSRGKLIIPNALTHNTAFILGLKPITQDSIDLQIRFRESEDISTVKYDQNDWQFTQTLPMLFVDQGRLTPSRCANCSRMHSTNSCMFPEYTIPCPQCLVISVDGNNHLPPCMPINRI